jgi:SPP1 family predicted phage head-tail adaptor
MIGAGELDRRIDLQSATITNDANYNEPVKSWSTYATVWAKMEHHTARGEWSEGAVSAREYAQFGLFFTIRYRSDVLPEHRIVFEGDNYELIGRPREVGRRQFLKVQVRLVE